jgi:hypothetical protein
MRFDDYLLRAIEQLSQAIARIVRALRGGDAEQAEQELSQAYDALLGGDRIFLDMVDAATLANLLGSPAKVRVLARLSALEAELARGRGDDALAERLKQRAHALAAIAHREDPQDGDDQLLSDLS